MRPMPDQDPERTAAIRAAILSNPDVSSRALADQFGVGLEWVRQLRRQVAPRPRPGRPAQIPGETIAVEVTVPAVEVERAGGRQHLPARIRRALQVLHEQESGAKARG